MTKLKWPKKYLNCGKDQTIWERHSKHMRREEKPTRCHWMLYCTYNILNMFRALLFPSSGARDYMCVITVYGVRCLVCWWSVRFRTVGYASGMRVVAQLQSSNNPHPGHMTFCPAPDLRPQATKASHTMGGNNTHIRSLELLVMGIEVPETCWVYYKCNKSFSGI
jgi:hypothetical protein